MTESAYSIFKRPSTLTMPSLFWNASVRESQGRCHYTPNLAQEINLSRIQRQLIADKGSFDDGYCVAYWPHGCMVLARWPEATFRAALPERCFRYLDCFNGGSGHTHMASRHPIVPRLSRSVTNLIATFKAVYLSSQLDRITQTKQGGCLYEWPYQIQALTTPVNLVGGAVMRTIPATSRA